MTKLQRKSVKLGLEKVLGGEVKISDNARIGLICNQASVNHSFRHSVD